MNYLVTVRLKIRADPKAMLRLRRKILRLPADEWLGTSWDPDGDPSPSDGGDSS